MFHRGIAGGLKSLYEIIHIFPYEHLAGWQPSGHKHEAGTASCRFMTQDTKYVICHV